MCKTYQKGVQVLEWVCLGWTPSNSTYQLCDSRQISEISVLKFSHSKFDIIKYSAHWVMMKIKWINKGWKLRMELAYHKHSIKCHCYHIIIYICMLHNHTIFLKLILPNYKNYYLVDKGLWIFKNYIHKNFQSASHKISMQKYFLKINMERENVPILDIDY